MRNVALFYSIILSPTRRIGSADLLAVADAAGVTPITTALSTGNLIFDDDADAPSLETRLESATQTLLGKAIAVFVRSAADFRAFVAANPFPAETAASPAQVAARVLRHNPSPETMTRLRRQLLPGEALAQTDRALWISTPGPMSQSPLLRAVAASHVGPGTLRNASALHKIAASLA